MHIACKPSCVWRSEDDLWEWVLAPRGCQQINSGHQAWWQHYRPLSHLDGSHFIKKEKSQTNRPPRVLHLQSPACSFLLLGGSSDVFVMNTDASSHLPRRDFHPATDLNRSAPQGSTLLFLKHSGHVGRVLGTKDRWVTQLSWHKEDLTPQKGLFAQGVEVLSLLSLLLPGNQDAPSMTETQYLPGRYSFGSLWLNCLRRQSLQICFCYKLIQERVVLVFLWCFVLFWF